MPIVYPAVSYAPIINAPTDQLIYQSGSRVERTEYQMDTRTKKYKGFLPYYQALAEAMIGTYDSDYPQLKCVAWSAEEGDVSAIVSLQYKGVCNDFMSPIMVKAGFPFSDVSLQSSSVPDDGYNYWLNGGTDYPGVPTSVWFQYYAPQTTWKWVQRAAPDSARYTAIVSPSVVVSPFNCNPPTPTANLQYQIEFAVMHYHAEPAGDWWECEATTGVQIIPHDAGAPFG